MRDVPDFPKPGILFKDITPLLADGGLFPKACEKMAAPFKGAGVTLVAAIESRGFLLGGPVAQALGAGVVPIRKVGKLPYTTRRVTYQLEYGTDALEVHVDACAKGANVLIVDDVLATGGTAAASCELIESVGGRVVGERPFADLGGVLVELAGPGAAAVDAEHGRRTRPIKRERERQRQDADAGVRHDRKVLDGGQAVLRLRSQRGGHRPHVGPGRGDHPLAGLIVPSTDGD